MRNPRERSADQTVKMGKIRLLSESGLPLDQEKVVYPEDVKPTKPEM